VHGEMNRSLGFGRCKNESRMKYWNAGRLVVGILGKLLVISYNNGV